MKKIIAIILLCVAFTLLFSGCQTTKAEPSTAIANPWSDWDSLKEAESAVGFPLGLPEVIAGSFEAVTFRTMNQQLLEVTYRDEDFEVCVRKQAGEGQDISGDYNEYETRTEVSHNGGTVITYQNTDDSAMRQVISCDGYSWSLVAPNGYWGDSNQDFMNAILGE